MIPPTSMPFPLDRNRVDVVFYMTCGVIAVWSLRGTHERAPEAPAAVMRRPMKEARRAEIAASKAGIPVAPPSLAPAPVGCNAR